MRNLLFTLLLVFPFLGTHAQNTEYLTLNFGEEDCNWNYFPNAIGINGEITLPEGFQIPEGFSPHPGLTIRYDDPNLFDPNTEELAGILEYDSVSQKITFVVDIPGIVYVQEHPEIMHFGAIVDFIDWSGNETPFRIETHPDSLIAITLPWTVTDVAESEASNFLAYPNPIVGDVTVTVTGLRDVDELISVYHMTGKKVRSAPVSRNGTQRLDVSGLPVGMYILEVASRGGEVRHIKMSKSR